MIGQIIFGISVLCISSLRANDTGPQLSDTPFCTQLLVDLAENVTIPAKTGVDKGRDETGNAVDGLSESRVSIPKVGGGRIYEPEFLLLRKIEPRGIHVPPLGGEAGFSNPSRVLSEWRKKVDNYFEIHRSDDSFRESVANFVTVYVSENRAHIARYIQGNSEFRREGRTLSELSTRELYEWIKHYVKFYYFANENGALSSRSPEKVNDRVMGASLYYFRLKMMEEAQSYAAKGVP